MKYQEFLKSILTDKQIQDLNHSLEANKVILISGIEGPTGKSTFKDILIRKGYKAIEKYEVHEIELNKVQNNLVPNLAEEITDQEVPVQDMEFRRFDLLTVTKEEKDKFLKLLESKNLSREDLIILLKSIRLRDFN